MPPGEAKAVSPERFMIAWRQSLALAFLHIHKKVITAAKAHYARVPMSVWRRVGRGRSPLRAGVFLAAASGLFHFHFVVCWPVTDWRCGPCAMLRLYYNSGFAASRPA